MLFRERVALTLPSLILRVVLGGTFLWAGLGKLAARTDLPPAGAARLAVLGARVTPNPAPAAMPARPVPGEAPATPAFVPSVPEPRPEPAAPLPDPIPDPAPDTTPDTTPMPTTPVVDPAPETLPEGLGRAEGPGVAGAGIEPVAFAPTAADFPHGGSAVRAMGLALLIDRSANPGLDEQSRPLRPIWPSALGTGRWPVTLAWAAALTELLAGVLLIVGLFTRPAALSIAGVMLVAAWLTEVGPAWQTGAVVWGFIPARDPWDPGAWKTLLWQLSLLGSALAVALLGSGRLGLDAALFRRREPVPAAPARRAETP